MLRIVKSETRPVILHLVPSKSEKEQSLSVDEMFTDGYDAGYRYGMFYTLNPGELKQPDVDNLPDNLWNTNWVVGYNDAIETFTNK